VSELKTIPKQAASPLAALTLALATLSCCVPFGFLGALGLAGAATALQAYRPWLIGGAILLIGFGFYQLYGRKQQCRTRSGTIMFWVSAIAVLVIFLFPQVIASIVAGLS
jgi:hypothetical protein